MSAKGAHIVRTALQSRRNTIFSASIAAVQRISPTVKSVTLKVDDSDRYSFKAGQWLDFFAPGISHIGGFSMWSPPHEFAEQGSLQLAIKRSEDPVAKWIHGKCSVGDQARFRFGGDFYYDPLLDKENHSICLIAGGVGMNPLMSILSETMHHDRMKGVERNILLLQSAKNEEELLYQDKTRSMAQNHDAFHRSLFVTEPSSNPEITNRRLSRDDLRTSIQKCGINAKYFICGPTPMIDHIHDILIDLGIIHGNVHFEKWS